MVAVIDALRANDPARSWHDTLFIVVNLYPGLTRGFCDIAMAENGYLTGDCTIPTQRTF